MTNSLINQLCEFIQESKYLVAFTGAGISTESGLPDYRGPNGVWTRKDLGLKPLPTPQISSIKPNKGHIALVNLLNRGILKFIISQNVDNLHIKSGIPYDRLAELHGNHNLVKCLSCDLRYTLKEVSWERVRYGPGYQKDTPHPDQPKCPSCQGRLISSVINFGDEMPKKELNLALYHAKQSDLFLVLGSSLVVQPAASLPFECYTNGGSVIIINKGETPLDSIAKLRINDSVGDVLNQVVTKLKR